MLDLERLFLSMAGVLCAGARFHRAGLRALHERRFAAADAMFEAALVRYRREIEVEAIARVRTHQLMARVLSGAETRREAEYCLDIEHRLMQLDAIESPAPPFELVDAHALLGTWQIQARHAEGRARAAVATPTATEWQVLGAREATDPGSDAELPRFARAA